MNSGLLSDSAKDILITFIYHMEDLKMKVDPYS